MPTPGPGQELDTSLPQTSKAHCVSFLLEHLGWLVGHRALAGVKARPPHHTSRCEHFCLKPLLLFACGIQHVCLALVLACWRPGVRPRMHSRH